MSSEKIKVDTVRLSNDANVINNCIKKMNQSYSRLEAGKNELDAMWDGEASEEFKLVFQEDLDILNTFLSNLNKLYRYEVFAKKKYDSCENKVSEMVRSISV